MIVDNKSESESQGKLLKNEIFWPIKNEFTKLVWLVETSYSILSR